MSSRFIVVVTGAIIFFTLIYLLPYFLYTRYFRDSKLKISYPYNGLLVSYRWIHTLTFASCVFSLIFFLLPIILFLDAQSPLSEVIWGSALAGVGCLVMIYSSFVGFLNRTTVFVDSGGEITSTYGPLVAWRILHRVILNVEKIYYKPIISSQVPPAGRYPIWAENSLGQKIVLFDRIDSESDAVMLIEEIKQHLTKQGSTDIQIDYPVRID